MKIAATLATALVLLHVATAAAEDPPLPPGFQLAAPAEQQSLAFTFAANHVDCAGIFEAAAFRMEVQNHFVAAAAFRALSADSRIAALAWAGQQLGAAEAAQFERDNWINRRAFWLREVGKGNGGTHANALGYCMDTLGEERQEMAERAKRFPSPAQ